MDIVLAWSMSCTSRARMAIHSCKQPCTRRRARAIGFGWAGLSRRGRSGCRFLGFPGPAARNHTDWACDPAYTDRDLELAGDGDDERPGAYGLLLLVGIIDNVLKPIVMARGVATPMPIILIGVIGGTIAHGISGFWGQFSCRSPGLCSWPGCRKTARSRQAPSRATNFGDRDASPPR